MLNLLSIKSLNLKSVLVLAFGNYSLLGLIHLILWIIAAIEILKSGKSAGNKLLWILAILFLPLIGLILYYLIGR